MKKTLAGTVVLALAVLASCSKFNDDRGIGDAPADQQPDRHVKVWAMPDTFANVAAQCLGENGIYVTTREAAPVVVANDPNCDEGGVLAP